MKRHKDDDMIMGPMFPRLHVNDTEKGGPRAPPRNKMALYEQLSIPSQRFNPGVLLHNPNNSSSWVPTGSNQGGGLEKNMVVPSRASPLTSTNLAEKFSNRQLGGVSVNTPSTHIEQRKEVRDDDNFTVPVFVESKTDQQYDKTKNGFDREKITPLTTTSGHQIKPRNIGDKDPSRSSSSGVNLRNDVRNQNEKSLKVCSKREPSVKLKTAAALSTREKIDGDVEEANVSFDEDCGDRPAIIRLHENDACSVQEFRAGREPTDNRCINGADLMRGIGEEILPWQRSMTYSEGNQSVPDATDYDSQCRGGQAFGSLQCMNGDKSDDASETSMVDSVSGMDISPDDVVGIIGQKCFWKARREISNQQRVFALQVFELHRLIKVQRLIAGSPHFLLEDATYLSKTSFEGSPAKKLPSEFIIKPLPHSKHKDDSEKPSHKMECSAENAVGRTSLSSVKNCRQPSNCGPFIGNPPPALVNGDNKINPWCFPQSGHQWLVPVMSPSEGLIYKPYPGPGFMGSACGGCGPFGQAPMAASFMTSPFGVPAPHQGIGVLPGAPPVGHSYFLHNGMPIMNPSVSGSAVEFMNQFPGPDSHAHSGQVSGGGANSNLQRQSSCNLPKNKDGAVSRVTKFQTSKDTVLQGSTASDPGENAQRDGTNRAVEGQNELPSSIPERASQLREANQTTRAIKVVPHNPRSATESAARIFLSIQTERKKHHAG
ncbi:putative 3'-5' exonuclease [Hibiscus syriacus]|uniref:3'-5' exonuclease n=1 Tax=Hibiscus syriacus TaxID=106335 RepID=A0A6A3A8E0_HIBSY|nr:protein EARLY FLOWERING 3-like [Hibiscus syriacus]KAE8700398.1 putative 3'-5' exonuclease [Hibiscus syriacus]